VSRIVSENRQRPNDRGKVPFATNFRITVSLQVYAALSTDDLDNVLREHLQDTDVIVRSTAAELIGQRPPSEQNSHALIEALPERYETRSQRCRAGNS